MRSGDKSLAGRWIQQETVAFDPSMKKVRSWAFTYLLLSVCCQDALAGLLDSTSRVRIWDMGQGWKREVSLELTAKLLDESLPHEPPRRVVWEGEIDGLVEELFEVFLGRLLRVARTTKDGDSRLIVDELGSPFSKGTLEYLCSSSCLLLCSRVFFISCFLLPLLFLFLSRPHLLDFINIYDCRFKLLCNDEGHSDHLLGLSFGNLCGVAVIYILDVPRGEIEHQWLGLSSNRANHLGLSSARRTVK